MSSFDVVLAKFKQWLAEATASEPADASAVCLSTIHPDGGPNARMVIVQSVDERGFVFFSHETSQKGRELALDPRCALVFHWKSLWRSVRVRGTVVSISVDESDAYWGTRPRSAQISAWASRQSDVLESKAALEAEVAKIEQQFAAVAAIPRPSHWHGFRVVPQRIEFWTSAGSSRLHDRVVFERQTDSGAWTETHLQP